MPRRALIVSGGWDGHQPKAVADLFHHLLKQDGFTVDLSTSLDSLTDEKYLHSLSLLIPNWTMGHIEPHQLTPLLRAVESGLGLAGAHGGMCDAFRDSPDWQFLTGGQWVAHPGNDRVTYSIHITDKTHPITNQIDDFTVTTEQYYMHIDPAIQILATTRFPTFPGPHTPNGPTDMPVLWTKLYGRGKIFYLSLGHTPHLLQQPPIPTLLSRGFLWSSRG
jgi:type 1 glutamine amidotransferase